MVLRPEEKQTIVAEVHQQAETASSAVVVDARGVAVEDMVRFRASGREAGLYVRVVKNTFARRALQGTEFECLTDNLTGPTLLVFASGEPGSAGRLCRDFANEVEAFEVRGFAVEGRLFSASEIIVLAELPTLEEALVRLAGTLKAPVASLATVCKEVPGKLVRTLSAVVKQQQAA